MVERTGNFGNRTQDTVLDKANITDLLFPASIMRIFIYNEDVKNIYEIKKIEFIQLIYASICSHGFRYLTDETQQTFAIFRSRIIFFYLKNN